MYGYLKREPMQCTEVTGSEASNADEELIEFKLQLARHLQNYMLSDEVIMKPFWKMNNVRHSDSL